jgi:histidine triad (HIT) family protein
MTEKDCLFCRIVAGEIPAQRVYEDAHCVAFRDINPQAPTHVLVVPRQHIVSFDEHDQLDADALAALFRAVARVAEQEGITRSGYRTVINSGADAQQSVHHLHVHVLGGRQMTWPPG